VWFRFASLEPASQKLFDLRSVLDGWTTSDDQFADFIAIIFVAEFVDPPIQVDIIGIAGFLLDNTHPPGEVSDNQSLATAEVMDVQ
jgi:hypothetical protein